MQRRSNGENSFAASGTDASIVRLSCRMKSRVSGREKQLKLIMIQSSMTAQQQDQLSVSSRLISAGHNNHEQEPILVVMIRNVSLKHDLKKLQSQMHF